MRSVFLRRLLLLIASAVLLSSLLTGGLYVIFASQLLINMKARELKPKAYILATLMADMQLGVLGEDAFFRFIGRDAEMWDAQMLLLDQSGNAVASTRMPGVEEDGFSPNLQKQIAHVMAGQDTEAVINLRTNGRPMLIVGTPVLQDGVVTGAVFMAKPIDEVNQAFSGFRTVLLSSLLIGLPIVSIFVFFTTRSFTRPMQQMRDAALAMSRGDFQIFAQEDQRGEMGELAFSLNHLSRELSCTISQLMQERNRLQWVLDSIGDGIVALDGDLEITHANPSVYRLLGVPAGDVEALKTRVGRELEPSMHDIRRGDTVSRSIQFGDQTVLKMTVSPIAWDDPTGIVALFQDISESERLEQTRREYVANVSHELRTPLTALRGLIEPLNDGMVDSDEDRARYYGIMLRETLRLARLVEDLMQLSRLQSGDESVRIGTFALGELMLDVEEKCRFNADDAGVQLEVARMEAKVLGNRDRVEQVLIILLDNACKFTPSGGLVEIFAQEEGNRIWVCVRDNGPGILPADLPHVFDRFYKADRARSSGGTGLGLSIAREILGRMDERIEALSTPGEGAMFRFSLTRAPDNR